MSEELSLNQHKQAVELHQKILISASLAQQNLWDMCSGLKQMRDGKLYKELGYQNFEDYCETEVGFSREQGRKYISIIENVSLENANTSWHLGVSKLYLLSTISESEQQKLSEKVNLEETTVKELKAEIDKLKNRNSELEHKSENDEAMKRSLQARLDDTGNAMRSAANEKKALEKENAELRENIKELENRPIDVAVVDNSAENERKLQEVIRSLERENIKRNEELEEQYREDEKRVRKMLEDEKQKELAELREAYEKKLAELPKGEPVDEDKLKFKVYLTSAYDSLKRLMDFTAQNTDPIYKDKIKQLLNSVLIGLEDGDE